MTMRKAAASIIVSIMVCAAAFAAYGQDKTSGAGKETATGTAGTNGQRVNQEKESYQKKAEEKLRGMDEKIKTLAAKAEKEGEKIKKDAAEKTREMQGKLIEKSRAAREKLEELKAAGSEKWQAVRKDLDRMLSELENAYHRAVSKMKSYEKQDR